MSRAAEPKSAGHQPAAPAPRELLQQLDGWLCNTGHDEAHPWRMSIARTLAAHPVAPQVAAGYDDSDGTGLDEFALTGALWSVHGVIQAVSARTLTLADELRIPVEGLEPIRRLCDVVAGMVETLTVDLGDHHERFYPVTAGTQGVAA